MDWLDLALRAVDFVHRETLMFAAVGFLIGGADDLAVDIAYSWYALRRKFAFRTDPQIVSAAATPRSPEPAPRLAIFVPAWDEAAVIGPMLSTTLARIDYPDYCIYVGTYPNDPGTLAAVRAVADADKRVRLVIGTRDGPTTKADCLNQIWHQLCRDIVVDGPVRAVVMHDAEDVVHPSELAVIAALTDRFDAVQLPVLPLIDDRSRLVSGHYCDEFAIAHGKHLPVREMLGAAMPLAGVGCAVRFDMLAQLSAARGGDPFDAASLTEDYELGLAIGRLGGRTRFARIREPGGGGRLVATRAFFPATLEAAVRQKARWMTGIALAGWDRTGWSRAPAVGDHWMRMRDRRVLLATLVVASAYLALVTWAAQTVGHAMLGQPKPTLGPVLAWLLGINAVLLLWRLGVRAWFVGRVYGPVEALWSLPRAVVANIIALLATRRAVFSYVGLLRGNAPAWDKTRHRFPDMMPEVLPC